MTNRHVPPTRPQRLTVIPLKDFAQKEVEGEIAFQITRQAQNPNNKKVLEARNARGISEKYGVSQQATARRMRGLLEADTHVEYVVHDEFMRFVGTGAIDSDPVLREQHGARPAWIERRWGDSPNVELAPEFSVFGWVGSGHWDRLGTLAAHRQVYVQLQGFARGDAYAVEPTATHAYIHSGIVEAGFAPLGGHERYDQLNGNGVPPLSQFYRSQSAIARTFEHPNGAPLHGQL